MTVHELLQCGISRIEHSFEALGDIAEGEEGPSPPEDLETLSAEDQAEFSVIYDRLCVVFEQLNRFSLRLYPH